jgi:hypothetical protein
MTDRDVDWLTPSEREPKCDCSPTVPRAVAAHVQGCAIDSGASRDELLDHARVADDVIQELAAALHTMMHYEPNVARRSVRRAIGLAALARVDALTKETR